MLACPSRSILEFLIIVLVFGVDPAHAQAPAERRAAPPNVILIVADDLGYGDLGCYGQRIIQTPHLNAMARQGMQFTQFYAGSTVCAPSRAVLMTGKHMGHVHVRGNAGGNDSHKQTLRVEDFTLAELFQRAGYRTSLIGKWGLGEVQSSGHPLRKGFDEFFGYLNQVHAHNYFPEFLWNGLERHPLHNRVTPAQSNQNIAGFIGGTATERLDYSHDIFMDKAHEFVSRNREQPFFLYLALTIPHANNEATRMIGNGAEVPDFGRYANEEWSDNDKGQAAMISRLDQGIGSLMNRLHELGIDRNTLVFFTSDNGPHDEAKHNIDRFHPAGPLRGIKRSLYEGGIRVPLLAWWPGTIRPGSTTDHVAYFGDFMATVADLLHAPRPDQIDSISFLPTLLDSADVQNRHAYLYWEFYEQGSRQAVRFGNWKAIRQPMLTGTVELYDLQKDASESVDIASLHPDVVNEATEYMRQAHIPNPNWNVPMDAPSTGKN